MNSQITIAVVTKGNPTKLARCLRSIINQRIPPKKILIIDNDSNQTALPVVRQCTKVGAPMEYVYEPGVSVPEARNRAIVLGKTTLLGFTDDDCVLDPSWTRYAITTLKSPLYAFVLGKSLLLNPGNVIARVFQVRYDHWLKYELTKHHGAPSPFLMDTKNVVYKAAMLRKNRVRFRSAFQINGFDSADTDIGFQLAALHATGVYNRNMLVYHEETPTLPLLIKKAYHRGRLAMLLSQAWNLKGEFIHLPDRHAAYYLRRMRHWPEEFRSFVDGPGTAPGKRLAVFSLLKLHDFVYLRGFVDQAASRGINPDVFSKQASV